WPYWPASCRRAIPWSSRYSVASTRSSAPRSPPRAASSNRVISASSAIFVPWRRIDPDYTLLALAASAPDAGALADAGLSQAGAAPWARGTAAPVHRQLLDEVAGAAVGADEVAQGGPSALDRRAQHRPDSIGQPPVPLARDGTCGRQRRNARSEQRLGRIDVAHSDHPRLVHQEGLHRRPPVPAEPVQPVPIEVRAQWLRSQRLQQRVHLAWRLPEQAAEPARIVETQHAATV